MTCRAYYNEIDLYAAEWLRNLIAAVHIAPGDVDERSIEDVRPDDLRGYTQCHFFAGIGGWSLALRLAGWPDSRSVWTGSCPCQPFSAAGKGAGFDDQRHLWPAWFHLVRECGPATLFGEQVASKAADPWLDLVQADLEGMGYAFGCVPFPAAGIGAPHIRDRNYWGAFRLDHADHARPQGHAGYGGAAGRQGSDRPASEAGVSGWMADADCRQCEGFAELRGHECNRKDAGRSQGIGGASACGEDGGMADATDLGRIEPQRFRDAGERPGPLHSFWRPADWILCRDGKWRPVEAGTFPLASRIPNRVGRLRAYGNAIVAPQAAEFARAAAGCLT